MNQYKNEPEDKFSASEERKLIRLAKSGDFTAFERLYEQNFPAVFRRVGYRIPVQDVEDVTQEIFTAAVRSLKSFRGNSKFSTWLQTLTNRHIANYYRKRNRTEPEVKVDIDDVENVGSLNSEGNPNSSKIDDTILLTDAITKLPEHYQEILLLRFADGMKFQDIAVAIGKSVEGTKSLFRRAISALRDQLGDMHD